MSVYNGENFIHEAMESILNQTFTNYEFLIIDDASTDRSAEILNSYKDSRIRYIRNTQNIGLTRSLNNGLKLAQGIYIARMDCDDISLPERLQRQVEFMDRHPEVGVCGTWVRTIGDRDGEVYTFPTEHKTIASKLFFENVIAHPSVIIRKKYLDEHDLSYDTELYCSQDYEFWIRCSKYFYLSNIPEVLLLYRLHGQQIRNQHAIDQLISADSTYLHQLENYLGITPSEEELSLHRAIIYQKNDVKNLHLKKINSWFAKLIQSNKKTQYYPEPQFTNMLREKGFSIFYSRIKQGLWDWSILNPPTSVDVIQLGLFERLHFFLIWLRKTLTNYIAKYNLVHDEDLR